MKTIKGALAFVVILAAFLAGSLNPCRAQILIGGVTNPSESLVQLSSVPVGGTFWSAQLSLPPWPFDPLPQLPVYGYGPASNGVFIIDDRTWDYGASWAPFSTNGATASGGGMFAMDDDSGPPSLGSGAINFATNGGPIFTTQVYTTNDLWLQIITMTNDTAALVIHPPWNVTNGVYDLQYTTNLMQPISWQWVLRTAPGQTNLLVTNATDPQGFYRASLINPSSGTDFWTGFLNMVWPANYDFQLSLYVSSQTTNSGTVSIPLLDFTNNFSLTAGSVMNIAIPLSALVPGFGVICTNGIHITASQPVSVYGIQYEPAFSAAFDCYPTRMLGTNYCILARPSDACGYYGQDYESQFAILGTASNTTVTIQASATADLWWPTGTNSYTFTVNQGQIFQDNSSVCSDDVTGTLITSDNPIAVFAGANLAFVTTGYGNPLVQEQLPVATWGEQVFTLSFGRTGGDIFRVLSATDNTVVTIVTTNSVTVVTNMVRQFYETNLAGPVEFQANKPIQVAQFAQGGDTDTNGNGDPAEILLPPTGHYLTSYTIAIPAYDTATTGDFTNNFLNLIVPQSAISATLVDGSAVAATNYVAIGSSGYSATRVPVATGDHTVSSSQPIEVEVYGFGYYDAYSYIAGVTAFP